MSLQAVEQYAPMLRETYTQHVEAIASLAVRIAATGFVPDHYRDKPDEITAVILWGEEIGLQPMQSLRSVIMVHGNPSLKAETMRALVLGSGRGELVYRESTGARCTVAGRRAGSEQWHVVTWDTAMARAARLSGDNWARYPRAMLKARATAELCRDLFADLIGGLSAVEELDDAGQPQQPQSTRRVRRTQTPASTPRPTTPTHLGTEEADVLAGPNDAPQPLSTAVDEDATQVQAATSMPADPAPGEADNDAAPAWPYSPPLGGAQRNLLMRLWGRLSISDRDERLALTSVIVGRTVNSTNELTAQEASDLIDVLDSAVRSEHPAEVVEGIKRLHGLIVNEPMPFDEPGGDSRE